MAPATAVGIAILAGVVATALARRARGGPPAWVLGAGVASVVSLFVPWGGPRWEDDLDRRWVLRVAHVDGRAPRTIEKGRGYAFHLAWSPDGKHVAVSNSFRDETALVLVAADGSDVRRLPVKPEVVAMIAWSPDGRLIACAANDLDKRSYIVVLRVDNGEGDLVADDIGQWVFGLHWSPDGSRLAWVSKDGPTIQASIVNSDATGRRRLFSRDAWAMDVRWRPDGSGLLATGGGQSVVSVHEVGLDGESRELIRLQEAVQARVSPDCSRFAAMVDPGPQVHLEILDLAGGPSVVPALPEPASILDTSWADDGRTLAACMTMPRHAEMWLVDAVTGSTTRVARARVTRMKWEMDGPPYARLLDDWQLLKQRWFWESLFRYLRTGPHMIPIAGPMIVSPDGKQIAFIEKHELPQTGTTAGKLRFLLLRVLGPLAFVWGIIAWRRQGRSATAVLCVVAGLAPTVVVIAWAASSVVWQ